MPCLTVEGHILSDSTRSLNQEMCRDSQLVYFGEERMNRGIQAIAEQVVDVTSTKYSGRQTDVMDNQQTNIVGRLPLTPIG